MLPRLFSGKGKEGNFAGETNHQKTLVKARKFNYKAKVHAEFSLLPLLLVPGTNTMSLLTILTIALALALDAFAVALAAGISLPWVGKRHTFRLAWHFGLFQGGMNILGWCAGLTVRSLIERFDHWLAFALLAFVGGRMIVEALSLKEEGEVGKDPTRGRTLVLLSVATSIDSLAVGLSFAVLKISVWFPALIIGVIASLLTGIGLHLGRLLGSTSRLGSKVEVASGLVLIAIGMRLLHEHGAF